MFTPKVERLLINYKTLEEFKNFNGNGVQELCMYEDLRANLIDNDSESPFYGIFFGDSLIARMSLYEINTPLSTTLMSYHTHVELYKLEVLSDFHRKGLGSTLVQFAKKLNMPIKAISRAKSDEFWLKQGFSKVEGEDEFYVWTPPLYTGEDRDSATNFELT
ncbi:N-acetyltransferase [Priestia taiwanensis]|uniref:N-acetyltransferase n=1 Tax=Priestia taiwanensis TaxID=1347902 RepID=A0A917ENC7_9BACI|nr:N-acetyltransferase [Priestia taiwanensis]MBM7362945.1 GNAT superfamily N-acetyltransferase [Priestia taiwanensis]GGE66352.1 putative N-acetyltransferase [Priestia taiwanensis]